MGAAASVKDMDRPALAAEAERAAVPPAVAENASVHTELPNQAHVAWLAAGGGGQEPAALVALNGVQRGRVQRLYNAARSEVGYLSGITEQWIPATPTPASTAKRFKVSTWGDAGKDSLL